jgi:nucleoside-diphosphate-sugar epimerase
MGSLTTTSKVLISGGQGFVGSYVAQKLLKRKIPIVIFDKVKDDHILEQVITNKEEINKISRVFGDISNIDNLKVAFEQNKLQPFTHIIHLAALQIPACRTNPMLGAQVNIIGTLNMFELAKTYKIKHIVYTSSAGVVGRPEEYQKPIVKMNLSEF